MEAFRSLVIAERGIGRTSQLQRLQRMKWVVMAVMLRYRVDAATDSLRDHAAIPQVHSYKT